MKKVAVVCAYDDDYGSSDYDQVDNEGKYSFEGVRRLWCKSETVVMSWSAGKTILLKKLGGVTK